MQEKKDGFVLLRRDFWRGAAREIKNRRTLAVGGMLSAIGVVFKFLSIPITDTLKFNFHSFPLAVAGYLHGPWVAGLVGIIVDILGFIVRPTGPYFPGFTFNAFVSGFVYGCWLYKRDVRLWRVFGAVMTSTLLVSFLLNPLMLQYMYGTPFLAIVTPRVFTNAILVPCYTAVSYLVLKVLERNKRLALGR